MNAVDWLIKCEARLAQFRAYNLQRAAWYDAKKDISSLGISLPRRTSDRVKAVLGWPALVVDSLEERLNIDGLVTGDGADVVAASEVWAANDLDVEYSQAHIEAMIHGVCFLTAQRGADGDPSPTITVESPFTMTGFWDPVRRDLEVAAAFVWDEDKADMVAGSLFTREFVARFVKDNKWEETDRFYHHLGRVPVRRLVNRARTGRKWGASEITPSIISATAAAVRTLGRSEIASEFFSAPQRIMLGVDPAEIAGEGLVADKWRAYLGSILAIADDKTDPGYQRPTIEQLPAASPSPFIDLVRLYSQLVAGEAALPPSYLGFETANPSSADQIRAVEARHVKRAERKQRIFGKAWAGIILDGMQLAGHNTTNLKTLAVNWADAATPTRAATADATVKLVSAGVLPATSKVTFEQLGYDPVTVERLVVDAQIEQARKAQEQIVLMPSENTTGMEENLKDAF